MINKAVLLHLENYILRNTLLKDIQNSHRNWPCSKAHTKSQQILKSRRSINIFFD